MALTGAGWRIVLVLLAALLTGLLAREAPAQVIIEDPALLEQPIDSIEIVGNKVTKPEIILREMRTRAGSKALWRRLEYDWRQVRDLGLFNRVQFRLTRREGKVVLIIELTEEWYIFPVPYYHFKQDDPDQLIYGMRYRQNNFRGRNETLLLNLWNGADRGFQVVHSNPWVSGTPELSRYIEFFQLTTISQRRLLRDLDLEERHSRADVRVGKRWTLELNSSVGVKLRLIQANNAVQLATDGGLDRILETQLSTTYDARDLQTFPRSGSFLGASFRQGWILNGDAEYRRLELDLRGYLPWRNLSFAGRAAWLPGWGSVPPYDWIYVQATSPIRSARLDDEGNSFYQASFETRMDLLPVRYLTWHKAPIFKQYFTDLGFGLSAAVFVDAGDAYFNDQSLSATKTLWGYGAGLLFILPYVDVMRAEVSFNPRHPWSAAQFSLKNAISF